MDVGRVQHRVKVQPEGLRDFALSDLVQFQQQVKPLVSAGGSCWKENSMLKSLWRLINRRMSHRDNKDEDREWLTVLLDWNILPVRAEANRCELLPVSLACLTIHPSIGWRDERLEEAVLECGIYMIQDSAAIDRWPDTFITTDIDVVRLLASMNSKIQGISSSSRHCLLSYLSRLCLNERWTDYLTDATKQLPLFKLASGAGFTDLTESQTAFFCLNPDDPMPAF